MKTIVISAINHSYGSYVHQLSDSELGHHLEKMAGAIPLRPEIQLLSRCCAVAADLRNREGMGQRKKKDTDWLYKGQSHMLYVCYIYLHLCHFWGKCR